MAPPREIRNIFRVIASESDGESMRLMRLMIETEEWDKVSQMSRLYDTYLRKDVLQPLSNRLGENNVALATQISDEVLQTFIGIDKAAKKANKVRCLALVDELVLLINRYLALEPGKDFRAEEAAKLGLKEPL